MGEQQHGQTVGPARYGKAKLRIAEAAGNNPAAESLDQIRIGPPINCR